MKLPINELLFMAGKWSGRGLAEYPTIAPAEYEETLVFEYDYTKDIIFYVQKTNYSDADHAKNTLHRESGFIIQTGEGKIELSNSQSNGRVEVLKLTKLTIDSGKTCAFFTSKHFGNDERMISTVREYTLEGDILCYEMKMATNRHHELKTHLKAELKREA